jgi:hypothetical protein
MYIHELTSDSEHGNSVLDGQIGADSAWLDTTVKLIFHVAVSSNEKKVPITYAK